MAPKGDYTKGTVIRRVFEFVEEFHASAANDVRERAGAIGLAPSDVLPSAWYPSRAYFDLLEAVTDRCLDRDPRGCLELGRFALERDLSGIYSAFVRMMRPSFLIRMAPTIWRQYHTEGTLRAFKSDRRCEWIIERERDPSLHEWWVAIGGTLQGLGMVGAKDLGFEVHAGVGTDAAPQPGLTLRFETWWT